MLRTLLLTPDFPPAPGGIQIVMHRIARHSRRLRIRVVTRASEGAAEFDRSGDLEVVRAGRARGGRLANAALNGRALVVARDFRPELVLSGHIVTSPAAWTISRALRVPFVQYLHADEMRHRPRLASFAVRRAAATVAVSSYTGELAVAAGAQPGRVHRVPNGVDLAGAAGGGGRAKRPTIITVARLERRYKGHDVLVRALPMVRERVPEVEWIVVGDGSLRGELERAVSAAGLEPAVRFLGRVSDERRDALLDGAHVFAMPSRLPPGGVGGEGFGIACLEASAHAVPVVAGDVGGVPDAVVHGETGLLVDPTDHRAVAEAISGLLLDSERAEALGRAGRDRARGFAWPLVVGRLEDLLLRVAGREAP